MTTESPAPGGSKSLIWIGRVISALPVLMLVASGAAKLAKPAAVTEEFNRLGYQESVIIGIGIVEIACAVIYAIPQTAVLGAILLTGYLGGATATHVRAGDPFLTAVLPPVIFGVLVWLGLYLRDGCLRKLVPFRTRSPE